VSNKKTIFFMAVNNLATNTSALQRKKIQSGKCQKNTSSTLKLFISNCSVWRAEQQKFDIKTSNAQEAFSSSIQ
jgi:hypothetical protein